MATKKKGAAKASATKGPKLSGEEIPTGKDEVVEEGLQPTKGAKPAAKPKVKEDQDARLDRLRQKPVIHEEPVMGADRVLPEFDPETQQLFEAPDGQVMVGSLNAERLWYPRKKMWINPLRESITAEQRAKKALAKRKFAEKGDEY